MENNTAHRIFTSIREKGHEYIEMGEERRKYL